VILWTMTGERVPLRTPVDALGIGTRRFDERFHLIGQSWLAHNPAH
jgi:hypothetical protein